jgi:hypothetical protein
MDFRLFASAVMLRQRPFHTNLPEWAANTMLQLSSDFGVKESSRSMLLSEFLSHRVIAELVVLRAPESPNIWLNWSAKLILRQGRRFIVRPKEIRNAIGFLLPGEADSGVSRRLSVCNIRKNGQNKQHSLLKSGRRVRLPDVRRAQWSSIQIQTSVCESLDN